MKCIRLLDGTDNAAVNELRIREYGSAAGFQVAPAGIMWNRSDDQSIVYGAWDGDALVATMRLEVLVTQELVERKLECPWSFHPELRFPVAVLSKAATDARYRASGLNAALRYHALSQAKEWGVQQVIGTFVADSPRIRTLEEMGYDFYVNEIGWTHADYRSLNTVLVAVLDFEAKAEAAQQVAARRAGPSLTDFPFVGERPSLRYVETVK